MIFLDEDMVVVLFDLVMRGLVLVGIDKVVVCYGRKSLVWEGEDVDELWDLRVEVRRCLEESKSVCKEEVLEVLVKIGF